MSQPGHNMPPEDDAPDYEPDWGLSPDTVDDSPWLDNVEHTHRMIRSINAGLWTISSRHWPSS